MDRERNTDRLAILDALRGACALLVVLSHALPTRLPGFPAIDPLNRVGKACVLVFFLISGFFLPITCEQHGSNARFWLRRLFRLFPAYWACLAAALAIYLCGVPLISAPAREISVGTWLLNLTMCQELFRRPSVLYVFWTLSFEVVIYVAFSLLFAVRLHRLTVALVVAILAGFAVVGLFRAANGQTFGIGGGRFLYFAPLMGLLASRWYEGLTGRGPVLALGIGQAVLLAVGWAFDTVSGRGDPRTTEEALTAFCVWSLAYGLFFLALAARRHQPPAWLVRIGTVSYSIYLFHILILSLLAPLTLPAWALLPVLFAASLAAGELLYRLVEAPGITLGRLLEKRLLPRRKANGPVSEGQPLARAA